jgi:hypothetical protein
MGQPLEIEIGQTKRDTEFSGKDSLSRPTISIDLAEEEKVSLTL